MPFSREDRLVRDIAESTRADCAFLALRRVDDPERMVVVGLAGPLAPRDQIEGGWPKDEKDAVYAFGHQRLSDDSKITDGILIPVRDAFGQAIGAIGVLSKAQIDSRSAVEGVVTNFTRSASSTIEQSIIDGELQGLVHPMDAHDFEARLKKILRSMSRISRAPIAFVSELSDDSRTCGRALMFLDDGEFLEPFDYSFVGGPCQEVYTQRICFHTQGIVDLYPTFELLQKLGACGYLGLPIEDARGRTLGHVGLMSRKPFPEDIFDLARMRIFASLIGSEVSRSKAAESKLEGVTKELEAQRLESLGLLAGGVAHDFNNLLASITTNVELALTTDGLSGELRGQLESIKRSTGAASELSSQLLSYAGRGDVRVEELDLGETLSDLQHLFSTSAGRSTLIQMDLASDLPAIQANRTQVGQLVMNIVLNGVDAAREAGGGVVTISTSMVSSSETKLRPNVGLAPPGDYVVLEVSDNGRGVDPALVPHIFDPFRSTKRNGRGLGLAIVHGIVKQHGAALFLESTPPSGTRIRVWFPVKPAEAPVASEPKPSQPVEPSPPLDDDATRCVLVVEDQEIVMEATCSVCRQLGFKILAAENGTRAIQLFEQHKSELDLVLLDVNLPDIDGRAVLRAIRAQDQETPVLMTSGYVRESAMEELSSLPRVGFVKKPFRSINIAEAIDRLQVRATSRT